MPELLPYKDDYYIWKYVPNLPAAITVSALWFIATIYLSWRMFKTKTWFCTAFIVGAFMEIIGFAGRAISTNKTNELAPYILQSVFILLPPTLFAATIYMCLARIIRLVHGGHLSIILPDLITKIFVWGDFLAFNIQGNAAGLTASTNSTLATVGKDLVISGLVLQLLSSALFAFTAIIFHSRLRQSPTEASRGSNQSWRQSLYMLYAVSVLIIIRSVYRVVEYCMGTDGYLLSSEWSLYAFDAAPMLVVAALFGWWYPDNLVVARNEDMELGSSSGSQKKMTKGRVIRKVLTLGLW